MVSPAICLGSPIFFDMENACIRSLWYISVSSALLIGFILSAIPLRLPPSVKATFAPFPRFLSVEEAESIINQAASAGTNVAPSAPKRTDGPTSSTNLLILAISTAELAISLALGVYGVYHRVTTKPPTPLDAESLDLFATAITSLYSATRAFRRHPMPTPPLDLFYLNIIQLIKISLDVGVMLWASYVNGDHLPASLVVIVATWGAAVVVMLVLIMGMPLRSPSERVIELRKGGGSIGPEDYSSLWGWISFSWTEDLIKRGTVNDLEEKDVPDLSFSLQSKPVFERFKELRKSTLLRHILAANSFDIFIDFFFTIVSALFSYASPFLLNLILIEIASNSNPATRARAYTYAALMLLASVAKAESDVQHLWFSRRAAARMRTEVMAAIYNKALRRKDVSGVVNEDSADEDGALTQDDNRNKRAKGGSNAGRIMQLMTSDVGSITHISQAAPTLYGAPAEIIIASTMLYGLLGWSAFAGFTILIIASPITHFLSKQGLKIARRLSASRDKRMDVLNELVGGIRFVKFFGWEQQWIGKVQQARQQELYLLVKDRVLNVLFNVVWSAVPTLISVVSFYVYVSIGHEMTIAKAFTAIALFNMLRMPLGILPNLVVHILNTVVAVQRIDDFLNEEDVPDHVSSFKRGVVTRAATAEDQSIGIMGATFAWTSMAAQDARTSVIVNKGAAEDSLPPPQRFELRNINVEFPPGKLSLIVGPTASGKTALLLALLGEMSIISITEGGDMSSVIRLPKNSRQLDPLTGLYNTISYCAQTPWLEHATIKQNILFYEPFEEERYTAVLRACALMPDLDVLEDGDDTEIGARGVSLSGGQKARVALARAVYARTKHVLLDDPLAAVDSHTARHLYEEVLMGPLMKGRTCILVTHHLNLVQSGANYLVRMLDGRIAAQQKLEDPEPSDILDAIVQDTAFSDAAVKGETTVQSENLDVGTNASVRLPILRKTTARKLVEDEKMAKGNVKWKIYKTYLIAAGWFIWVCLLLGLGGSQIFKISEKLWIKTWGEHYDQSAFTAMITGIWLPNTSAVSFPSAEEHPLFYVGIYAAIGLLTTVITITSSIVQYFGSYRASKRLFTGLLSAVVGSPMRFFDTTPTGRILNRFSKDMQTIDASLSENLQNTTGHIASFIAAVLTIIVLIPQFIVPSGLIAYVYYRYSYGYVVAGRSLRRMESTTLSPIFAAFGDMLEGLVTVRAFSKEKRFMDITHSKIDLTTKMWYNFWMLNRWLLLRFDTAGAFFTFLATIFAVTRLDAGLAGLTITSAMAFTTSVYWTCRTYTQLEMNLNSVERIVEYLDLPQEPPATVESNRVPAYWPSSATEQLLSVENICIRYVPELPPVLQDVSFKLRSKERVGLLGRTGSGKSTLAMALLRFVDPSSGKIVVDAIDISKIGLHDLRSRVTIVPQDAILFSGTIRENLDPFNEHSDTDCLDALSRVHINASVSESRQPSRPASIHESASATTSQTGTTQFDDQKRSVGLASKVSAGGANFSQGQRQLIALARALLRRSTIIIMDEATSSIDFHTDGLVQQTIREEFANSLLITIAHRIRTIIDYDRLVILDQGKLVEFDTPANLINKEDGVFRNMCLKSGHFEELVEACQGKASL